LLIAVVSFSLLPVRAQATTDIDIGIVRTVRFGDYGLAFVEDKFSLRNNGTAPLTDFDVGFGREYSSSLKYVEVKDAENRELQLDQDTNTTSNVYWMKVHLQQSVPYNQTYNFTMRMVLNNVVRLFELGWYYNFTAAPVVAKEAQYANVTIAGTAGSDFKVGVGTIHNDTQEITFEGRPAILQPYKPWPAFDNRPFPVNFTSVSQWIIRLTSFNRTITIQPTGDLQVDDSYRFVNPGITLTGIPIRLPSGARNVMAIDSVGSMWTEPRQVQDVTLAPRGTTSFQDGKNFTFTLSYSLPRNEYVKQMQWWGLYNFTFAFVSNNVNWLAENAEVRIITPTGLALDETSVHPDEKRTVSLFQEEYVFIRRDLTPLHNTTFLVEFTYSPFWALLEPASWIVAAQVAIIALAAVLRLRKPPALEIPIPVERVRDFVELYDEKMGLTIELERMGEDLERGGMTKHDYRRRRKVIDARLDELGKALNIAKTSLSAVHSRYEDMIRRLERSEAEIDATKVSEQQIRNQYRGGKITRETYETVLYDLAKRIDRARQNIETTIVTLREEAR
jgi:hypothetical protein